MGNGPLSLFGSLAFSVLECLAPRYHAESRQRFRWNLMESTGVWKQKRRQTQKSTGCRIQRIYHVLGFQLIGTSSAARLMFSLNIRRCVHPAIARFRRKPVCKCFSYMKSSLDPLDSETRTEPWPANRQGGIPASEAPCDFPRAELQLIVDL